METEYDDNVLENWRLPNGIYKKKLEKDDALDGDNDPKKVCHLFSELLFQVILNELRITSLGKSMVFAIIL